VRRYAVRDFQQVWVRSLGPADAGAGIRVRPAEPEGEDLWVDLFAEAFLGVMPGGMPGREALRAMAKVDGQAVFLAFEDGMAAGVALASDLDGVALLTGAGVIPAFRGRGLHGELVAARLTWARARGCDLAVSTTRSGTASQRTLERAGFRCAYPKAVLVGRSGTGRA
jgi:GNAT superfamily N-acetyltransferase